MNLHMSNEIALHNVGEYVQPCFTLLPRRICDSILVWKAVRLKQTSFTFKLKLKAVELKDMYKDCYPSTERLWA